VYTVLRRHFVSFFFFYFCAQWFTLKSLCKEIGLIRYNMKPACVGII